VCNIWSLASKERATLEKNRERKTRNCVQNQTLFTIIKRAATLSQKWETKVHSPNFDTVQPTPREATQTPDGGAPPTVKKV